MVRRDEEEGWSGITNSVYAAIAGNRLQITCSNGW